MSPDTIAQTAFSLAIPTTVRVVIQFRYQNMALTFVKSELILFLFFYVKPITHSTILKYLDILNE